MKVKNIIIGLIIFGLSYVGTSYLLKINKNRNQQKSFDKVINYMTKDEWVEFNSVEGKFKVTFPKYPQSNSQTIDGPSNIKINFTQYSATDGENNLYIAQVAEYTNIKTGEFDFKKGLEGTVNGSVASDKTNSLIRSEYKTINNYPGVTATIYNAKEKIYMNTKNFFVGNRLYSMIASNKEDKISESTTKFFDSLTLLDTK